MYGLIKRVLQCCLSMNVGMCCGLLFMVSTVMRERGDVAVKGELKTLMENGVFEKVMEEETKKEEEKEEEVKKEKEEKVEKKEEVKMEEVMEEEEEKMEEGDDEVMDLNESFFEDQDKKENEKEEKEEKKEESSEEEEEAKPEEEKKEEEKTPLSNRFFSPLIPSLPVRCSRPRLQQRQQNAVLRAVPSNPSLPPHCGQVRVSAAQRSARAVQWRPAAGLQQQGVPGQVRVGMARVCERQVQARETTRHRERARSRDDGAQVEEDAAVGVADSRELGGVFEAEGVGGGGGGRVLLQVL